MEWQKEKVLIIGAGISGIAAAKIVRGFGAETVLSDASTEDKIRYDLGELRALGIQVALGPQGESQLEGVTRVILSPAVPVKVPLVQAAIARQIPVGSEVELAGQLAKSPIYAVTGTNGKTTTTTLLGQLMETVFPTVGVGGNIGVPLCEEALRVGEQGCIVAEISSYQMEATRHFRPRIAAILNVTPDHIVRHGSMEVYQQMKEKIFAEQTAEDFLILNYDDIITRGMAERAKAKVCFFSRQTVLEEGAYVEDGQIVIRWNGEAHAILPVRQLLIKGGHNVENALAASAAAYLAGAEPRKIAAVLHAFPGVEHRIEPVRMVDGVMYYNDSKATNTDSAIKALDSFPEEPVVLIAGGDDKMTDLTEFMQLVKKRCRKLILVGDAAARFKAAAIKNGVPTTDIREAGYSMEKAVEIAHALAKPPQIVLLSPACASFDMFSGFEERGRVFKDLVKGLKDTMA